MSIEADIRAYHDSWLRDRVAADAANVPETLWHYTNAQGVLGIVEDQVLWSTDTRFLNDATELLYGVGLIVEALAGESRGRDGMTRRFLEGMIRNDAEILRSFLDRTVAAFVTCFCSRDDLLSRGRSYAASPDRSGGYALGFRSKQPQAWVQVAGHGLELRQVRYRRDDQEASSASFVHAPVDLFDNDPSNLEAQNAFGRHLVDGLVEIAATSKHPSFEEEQEWRVFYLRSTDPEPLPLQFRIGDGGFVPYVEVSLPEPTGSRAGRLPVRVIRVGPTRDPIRAHIGLEQFLSTQSGETEIVTTDSPLKV